jgi:hypothetical protein
MTTILDTPVTDIYTEPVNAVQKIAFSDVPDAGEFTVTFDGETTAKVAHNVSAANLQVALLKLPSLDDGDLVVTGDAKGPYTLTFGGAYAGVNVPAVTTTDTAVKKGEAVVTSAVTTVTAGSPGADNPLAVQRGTGNADRTEDVSPLTGDSPAEDRVANKANYGDA